MVSCGTVNTCNAFMGKILHQKGPAAILDGRYKLHLGSVELGFAEELSACEDTMQRTSEFICNRQLNVLLSCGYWYTRDAANEIRLHLVWCQRIKTTYFDHQGVRKRGKEGELGIYSKDRHCGFAPNKTSCIVPVYGGIMSASEFPRARDFRPPLASHKGRNIICLASWKMRDRIAASTFFLVTLIEVVDRVLPKGLVPLLCSHSLTCSREEKYPSSSMYQILPCG